MKNICINKSNSKEEVIFIGGNKVDINFPAVWWPKRKTEKAGYTVIKSISLVDGFQDTGFNNEREILESLIKSGPKHLVGYCAGGVLALDYIDHKNVKSVTAYDAPSGITVQGDNLQIEEPLDYENVFLIYADSIDDEYRFSGNYYTIEINGADHEFSDREDQLAEAVVNSLDYHTGKSNFEEISQNLSKFSSAYICKNTRL